MAAVPEGPTRPACGDAGAASGLVSAAKAAGEAGIDELLLAPEPDRSSADDVRGWLRDLARSVFYPIAVLWEADSAATVMSLLEAGAVRVVLEAPAVRDPDLIASLAGVVGPERVGIAVSASPRGRHWRVRRRRAGPDTEWDAVTWSRVIEAQGGGEIFLQSINDDRAVLDLDLLSEISAAVMVPVTVRLPSWDAEDVFDALMIGHADGVVVAAPFEAARGERVGAYLREHGVARR